MFKRGRRRRAASLKGTFDPFDKARVRHTRLGVWDLYEEIRHEVEKVPGGSQLERLYDVKQSVPFVWRMLRDIGSQRNCWSLLVVYALVEVIAAFIPAVSLWCVVFELGETGLMDVS